MGGYKSKITAILMAVAIVAAVASVVLVVVRVGGLSQRPTADPSATVGGADEAPTLDQGGAQPK